MSAKNVCATCYNAKHANVGMFNWCVAVLDFNSVSRL